MNPLKTNVLSEITKFFFAGCLLLFAGATVSIDAKIVFCVDGDIFVMNDDGSHRRRLTKNTQAQDSHPRWSPNGKRIAFDRRMNKTRQTTAEVFIMNADGTDPQRLTDNIVFDGHPSWSPDGQRLVFTRFVRKIGAQVFVLELATRAVRQLTGIGDKSAAPDWSPDGTQIVFERFIPIKNGLNPKTIYVMSADGQQQRPILQDPPLKGTLTMMFFPRWSADGQRILFSEVKWLEGREIEKLIIQRIGSRKKEIRDINDRLGNNWISTSTCWIENDRALLISLMLKDKPNPNYNLYRYTFETRGLRRLTSTDSDETWPDWTEGALSVSPYGKLTTQWGEIKQPAHAD